MGKGVPVGNSTWENWTPKGECHHSGFKTCLYSSGGVLVGREGKQCP